MPSTVVSGIYPCADFIMNSVFWVGVYPGLHSEQLDYMVESFHELLAPSNGHRGHAGGHSESAVVSERA